MSRQINQQSPADKPIVPIAAPGLPEQQKRLISNRRQLEQGLNLPASIATKAEQSFPVLLPEAFMQRMRSGDMHDPLLRQVLPVGEEDQDVAGYSANPLEEQPKVPGLLQKYRHRALLVAASTCPIHCRYCFRRHFDYGAALDHDAAVDAIANDPDIHEVILSGGDPLTLSNKRLQNLIAKLGNIPHLKRLRIHSRVPVVMPKRVDAQLVEVLQEWNKPMALVIHCNHPQEIDNKVIQCLQMLRDANIQLLNQAVLLHGVNNTVAVQRELWQQLFAIGVMPYYLHLLDRVQGAAHFAVSETRGQRIIKCLRASLPGYLVPRLAREVPGADSKEIIA